MLTFIKMTMVIVTISGPHNKPEMTIIKPLNLRRLRVGKFQDGGENCSGKFELLNSFKIMRRSYAPSQVLKRKESPLIEFDSDSDGEEKPLRKKMHTKTDEKPNFSTQYSQRFIRQPFTQLCFNCNGKLTEHESRIKNILSKPFKIPIPNYQGILF